MTLMVRLLLWALCAWTGVSAVAMPLPIPHHRPIRIFGIEHGLESLTITQLLQDRRGLIWIAYEQSGIGIFDGTRFHNLGLDRGLPSGLITALAEDARGVIWAGTYAGLARWDGTHFLRVAGPVGASTIHAVSPHPAGGVLVGLDEGLHQGGEGRPFTRVPGWSWGAPHALHLARDGRTLWASSLSPEGRVRLHRWVDQSWSTFDADDNFQGQPIERLAVDAGGCTWASAPGHLWRLDPRGQHFERVALPGLLRGSRPDFTLDPTGALWMCVASEVLRHQPDHTWLRLGSYGGIPPRNYKALLVDRTGTLWLAGAGLIKVLGGEHMRVSTELDGLPGPSVYAIFRDRDGTIWLGTNSGLVRGGPRGWVRVRGTEDMVIRSIVQVPSGHLVVCGNAGVLLTLDPRTEQLNTLSLKGQQPVGNLRRLLIGPEGQLVLATGMAGLWSAPTATANPTFAPVTLPEGSPREAIFDLSYDAQGRLWVAGGGGLAMLEGGRWRRFTQHQGLLNTACRYVRPTQGGDLLVGYIDPIGWQRVRLRGDRLEPQEHRHEGNGSQAVIWLLAQDRQGRTWAGGAKGLHILSGDNSEHVGRLHGLPSDDCNAQAFLAEDDGQVWIGTSEGLAHFRMGLHPGLPPPPRPVILSVGLGEGQAIHPGISQLSLPPRSTLSATLAAVSTAGEGQVRLEARLRGLDDAWTEVVDGRVRYPGLASGLYTLEVRTRIAAGAWSPVEAFAFRVQPDWWQTWWFRVLAAGALTLLVLALVRLRTAVLERRNGQLERMVDRRTLELVEAKERAERASGFKTVFLATVSHELRTPLNAIRGFLDLMDQGQLKPGDVPSAVRTMRGASEGLLQLINDLLDLGTLEQGALDLRPRATDLREILHHAHALLVSRIEQKDLLLFLDVDRAVPASAHLDPQRFTQMVVNLVGNALKFTARGHVRSRLEVIHRDEADLQLRFSVSDTGPGVPPDLVPHLFQAYAQGEGPQRGQGTGLGLSITRHLAERMSGEVGVDTHPGTGSTFWFTLRVTELAPPPASLPLEQRRVSLHLRRPGLRSALASLVNGLGATLTGDSDDLRIQDIETPGPEGALILLVGSPGEAFPGAPAGSRRVANPVDAENLLAALRPMTPAEEEPTLVGRVLLADDNPANRLLAKSLLEALGLACVPVEGGTEALRRLASEAFDLVLLDQNMPGLDGREVLQQIRSRAELSHLKVLLFTASGTMDESEARTLGFDGLLPKPMDLEVTRRVLASHLPVPPVEHWNRLAEVLGGPHALAAFMEGFLEDGQSRVPALADACRAQDRNSLERLAHDLKSNAAHLGLRLVEQLAAELETAAQDEGWERLTRRLSALERAWAGASGQVEHFRVGLGMAHPSATSGDQG